MPIGAAAKMLGVTPRTLRNWCNASLVSFYRLPKGAKRFRVGEIRQQLEESHVQSPNKKSQISQENS